MDNVAVTGDRPGAGGLPGLYSGIPLTRRTSTYAGVLPDRITIYRRAICAICHATTRSWSRSVGPWSTRSGTTSASVTPGCATRLVPAPPGRRGCGAGVLPRAVAATRHVTATGSNDTAVPCCGRARGGTAERRQHHRGGPGGRAVRRPIGRWTPAVHDLLTHLATVGFPGSPRLLGIDGSDREVLEFVPGEVGTLAPSEPLPAWSRHRRRAGRSVGGSATSRPRRWDSSRTRPGRGDARRAPRRPPAGDRAPRLSPYNTVRRADGSLVVLDWDFARPGDPSRTWPGPRGGGRRCSPGWWHAEYGVASDQDVLRRQRTNLAALLDGYGRPR